MRFKNREHAATMLAARLSAYKGANPLILGVPRAGVPMARIIADALGGDVDVAHGPLDVSGRIVIIVDDGVATGCSMLAAIRSVRARHPRKIVVAVAVAPLESLALLGQDADETICLQPPQYFFAVGQAFEDFSEVTDEMVVAALAGGGQATKRAHTVDQGGLT